MRVRSYKEALRIALCAGEDAANRRMRKAGRKAWTDADYDYAARVSQGLLTDLGFDVAGWTTMAGVPRNEPEPPARKSSKRRAAKAPVQLSFAFA